MRVRMLIHISGGRNGVPWPPVHGETDLPEAEAIDLIRSEMAVPADDEDAARTAEQPTPGHPSKVDLRVEAPDVPDEPGSTAEAVVRAEEAEPPGELGNLAPDVAGEDEAGDAGNAGDAAAEPLPVAAAPGPSAPKQAWIDYAVSAHGADVHAAGNMTKADLMSRYGGRL